MILAFEIFASMFFAWCIVCALEWAASLLPSDDEF